MQKRLEKLREAWEKHIFLNIWAHDGFIYRNANA